MSEPVVLTTLCTICHINPPKYTCPRCKSRTCSLTCSKRHKVWRDCNGVRDPTAYKPAKELRTPAGVDHDYNFISAIERGIERTDRRIVEDRGLVTREELLENTREFDVRRGRGGRKTRGVGRHQASFHDNRRWKNHKGHKSDFLRALENTRVEILNAPKGIRRNVENKTSWSSKHKCINWQVEWIQDDGASVLRNVLEWTPLEEAYAAYLEEARLAALDETTRRQENKRKARETGGLDQITKRRKVEDSFAAAELPIIAPGVYQNPQTTAWRKVNLSKVSFSTESEQAAPSQWEIKAGRTGHYFYLLRPNTPASQPKVLIPLPPEGTLSSLLKRRTVLEFPTIYAISKPRDLLPVGFMLESEYLDLDTDSDQSDEEDEHSTEEEVDDEETSSSGSDTESQSDNASGSEENLSSDEGSVEVDGEESDDQESDGSVEDGEVSA